MSEKTKKSFYIVIALMFILFVICICGRYTFMKYGNDVLDTFLVDNPEEATAFAHEMIDYELPTGYYEYMGQKLGLTNIMMIKRENAPLAEITLTEYTQDSATERFHTGELTIEHLAEEIHDARNYSMKLIQTYEMNINGTKVPMRIYTGVDEDGVEINQLYTGLFSGKRYPMIVFITGPVEEWNSTEMDAFLHSIH